MMSRMEGVSKSDVLTFLREYKTRECGGCEQLIGFQRRAGGTIVCDPNCSGTAAELVAVMEGGGGGGTAGVSTQDVLTFLRHFKTLECQCCDKLIGFQHRGSGLVYCNPECAGGAGQGAVSVKPLGDSARLNQAENANIRVPNGIVASARPLSDLKKERTIEIVGSTVPIPIRKAQDVADGSGVYLTPGGLAKRIPPCESGLAKANDFLNASNYRTTDKNPFVKTVPVLTAKDTAPAPKPKEPEVEIIKVVPSEVVSVDDERYKFLWKFAKYSPYISDGCKVKISFAWTVKEFQVVAEADEQRVVEYQEKVQVYVQQRGTRLTEPPLNGQFVFAEYHGEYYRARVTDVNETKCSVFFVDFGDRQKDVEYTTLFKPDRDLMDVPVFSIYVDVADAPELKRKAKLKGDLEAYMYENVFNIKMIDQIEVGRNDDVFKAMLTDQQNVSVGTKVIAHLKALPDATWEENVAALENEKDFLFSPENEEDLRRAVQLRVRQDDKRFIFNGLDNKTTYLQSDIRYPIVDVSGKPMEACLRYAEGLQNIFVFPTSHAYSRKLELISLLCEEYILIHPKSSSLTEFVLKPNEVFVVKFLPWEEMLPFLTRTKMTEARKKKYVLQFSDACYLNNRSLDLKPLWGKWFRSFVRNKVSGDSEFNENDCYWHCLIDYGITIAVPNKFTHKINGELMIPPACVFPVQPIYQKYPKNPTPAENTAASAPHLSLHVVLKMMPILMLKNLTVVALSPESEDKIKRIVQRRLPR